MYRTGSKMADKIVLIAKEIAIKVYGIIERSMNMTEVPKKSRGKE